MKEEFESIFNSLYESKVIFHERVTLLCEVVKYDLQTERFSVELNVIRPLKNTRPYENRMLKHITSKQTFTVGSTYKFAEVGILENKKIGRPYCPYTIWTDATLVEHISKLSGEDLKKHLQELLSE